MVKFINKITGTEMWVAEERAEEYKTAGHVPAVDIPTTEDPAKDTTKKRTKK